MTYPSSTAATQQHSERTDYPAFLQDGPHIGNPYLENTALKSLLQRLLPSTLYTQYTTEFERFGYRVVNELFELADEQERNQPYIQHYDAWGKRIDKIITTHAWQQQKHVAAEEGVISLGYQRKQLGEYSRIIQYVKLLLYAQSSGLYGCPLAMTDGAARLCELLLGATDSSMPSNKRKTLKQLNTAERELIQELYDNLTCTKPLHFITSGQWMTERAGGSDVGDGTQTVARLQPDGTYKLYGYKWFSSATDSDITCTLARIEDTTGNTKAHSAGLSCFIMRVKDVQTKQLNNIRVVKLKNKLGTKQLPTAELELVGSNAVLVSEPGRGIPTIVALVNITRLHNAISATAGMRHMIALARDFTHRRKVFNRVLNDNELHLETIADMEIQYRGALHLTLDAVARMGRVEHNTGSATDIQLLRLLTPIAKLYTAKQVMSVSSEGLEVFGGVGYQEDSKIPRILRDAQVLPIWEGTTNVLSHDVLRVLFGDKTAYTTFRATVLQRIKSAHTYTLQQKYDDKLLLRIKTTFKTVHDGLAQITTFLSQALATDNGKHLLEARCRHLSYSLARVYTSSLLIEHAQATNERIDWIVAERYTVDNTALFSTAPLVSNLLVTDNSVDRAMETRYIALDIDRDGKPQGFGDVDVNGHTRPKL